MRALAPKCGNQELGEEEAFRIRRMMMKTHHRLSLKPAPALPPTAHKEDGIQSSDTPASIPMVDPMAACKQMRGEATSRAMRKIPPVQGLSQPYTWPIPTGMALRSCTTTGSHTGYGSRQVAHTSTPKSHANAFRTGPYCVSRAGLGVSILLPQPLECTLTFYNGRHSCSSRLMLRGAKAVSSLPSQF